MPIFSAVSLMFSGPRSSASWMYTELSDFSVAWRRFIEPPYEPS